MASTAISNQYYDRVVTSTKILIISIAAFIMGIAGHTVINHKFDKLGLAAYDSRTPITMAQREQELTCLARNIYWEAAKEPFEGKVGVAQVTLNRVQSGQFANTVCGVVYEKNYVYKKVICQFSWVCEPKHRGRIPAPMDPALYEESYAVAKKVLLEGFRLPALKEAMYYHATYVKPGWRYPKLAQIGLHIFYKG